MITFFNKHIFVKPNTVAKHIFDYSRANWDDMNQYLSSFNFDECLQSNDVEFIWSQLKSAIYNTLNLFVPKFQIKPNTSPIWFTPTIRHKLHCVHTLRRQCASHPTDNIKANLRNMEHDLQVLMNEAKSSYESNLYSATHTVIVI